MSIVRRLGQGLWLVKNVKFTSVRRPCCQKRHLLKLTIYTKCKYMFSLYLDELENPSWRELEGCIFPNPPCSGTDYQWDHCSCTSDLAFDHAWHYWKIWNEGRGVYNLKKETAAIHANKKWEIPSLPAHTSSFLNFSFDYHPQQRNCLLTNS